ncbi:MAG: TIGR03617 family F420-dependent LLM class oxidoreductase [Microthrixaceae bacterium]
MTNEASTRPLALDTLLMAPPAEVRARAEALAATGVTGLFTFEGPHDPFLPLVAAADLGLDCYTNVAIAFPRSPAHLAHLAWDLSALSGGRFALGLGTQVKAHIERRLGATWSHPAARMEEWVGAVRAFFDAWQHQEPLSFEGRFTSHTLMTPAFDPGPLPDGPPPIWLGGLGPRMTELAATVGDGVLLHPFTSDAHLANVALPRVHDGIAKRADGIRPTLVGQAIVATGRDDTERADAEAAARWLVAFYGSTPAYRPVLQTEGFDHLHPEWRRLSREGRWPEMAEQVPDELLEAVVLRGDPAAVAARIGQRFAGQVDRVAINSPGGIAPETLTELVGLVRQ